jgi:hypothetical protein
MTVAQNIAFPLKMRKLARKEIARRVDDALALVRLEGYGGRVPGQLSAATRRRHRPAAAIAAHPDGQALCPPTDTTRRNARSGPPDPGCHAATTPPPRPQVEPVATAAAFPQYSTTCPNGSDACGPPSSQDVHARPSGAGPKQPAPPAKSVPFGRSRHAGDRPRIRKVRGRPRSCVVCGEAMAWNIRRASISPIR